MINIAPSQWISESYNLNLMFSHFVQIVPTSTVHRIKNSNLGMINDNSHRCSVNLTDGTLCVDITSGLYKSSRFLAHLHARCRYILDCVFGNAWCPEADRYGLHDEIWKAYRIATCSGDEGAERKFYYPTVFEPFVHGLPGFRGSTYGYNCASAALMFFVLHELMHPLTGQFDLVDNKVIRERAESISGSNILSFGSGGSRILLEHISNLIVFDLMEKSHARFISELKSEFNGHSALDAAILAWEIIHCFSVTVPIGLMSEQYREEGYQHLARHVRPLMADAMAIRFDRLTDSEIDRFGLNFLQIWLHMLDWVETTLDVKYPPNESDAALLKLFSSGDWISCLNIKRSHDADIAMAQDIMGILATDNPNIPSITKTLETLRKISGKRVGGFIRIGEICRKYETGK